MTFPHIQSKEFLIGAALGSLLGGVAAVLTAPKSGGNLREAMSDLCHDLKGKCLVKHAKGDFSGDWTDLAKSLLGRAKDFKESWSEEGNEEKLKDLLIGVAVGGLFGSLAGFLLAPKAGSKLRGDLRENAHDFIEQLSDKGRVFAKKAGSKAENWLDFAQQMIDEFTEEVGERKEELKTKTRRLTGKEGRMDQLGEWISLGTHLWKTLKEHR